MAYLVKGSVGNLYPLLECVPASEGGPGVMTFLADDGLRLGDRLFHVHTEETATRRRREVLAQEEGR